MRIIRDREEIIEAVLRAAQAGQNQTGIMYKTMLSFSQIKDYLLFLKERNLIFYDPATQLYTPTNKGMKFIEKSAELSKLFHT